VRESVPDGSCQGAGRPRESVGYQYKGQKIQGLTKVAVVLCGLPPQVAAYVSQNLL